MFIYAQVDSLTLPITSPTGIPVATDYTRIVHGGRGAYVEFSIGQIIHDNIFIPDKALWRVSSPNAYFVEFCTLDGVKLYFQLKEVDYADYKPSFYYISPIFLCQFYRTKDIYSLSPIRKPSPVTIDAFYAIAYEICFYLSERGCVGCGKKTSCI